MNCNGVVIDDDPGLLVSTALDIFRSKYGSAPEVSQITSFDNQDIESQIGAVDFALVDFNLDLRFSAFENGLQIVKRLIHKCPSLIVYIYTTNTEDISREARNDKTLTAVLDNENVRCFEKRDIESTLYDVTTRVLRKKGDSTDSLELDVCVPSSDILPKHIHREFDEFHSIDLALLVAKWSRETSQVDNFNGALTLTIYEIEDPDPASEFQTLIDLMSDIGDETMISTKKLEKNGIEINKTTRVLKVEREFEIIGNGSTVPKFSTSTRFAALTNEYISDEVKRIIQDEIKNPRVGDGIDRWN